MKCLNVICLSFLLPACPRPGIMEEIKKWNADALELFVALLSTKESEVQNRIADVKGKLQTITTMIHELSKQSQSGEDISEIIERELSTMDKAIEEAASRIEVCCIGLLYLIFAMLTNIRRELIPIEFGIV